jgi:hypothetical protein
MHGEVHLWSNVNQNLSWLNLAKDGNFRTTFNECLPYRNQNQKAHDPKISSFSVVLNPQTFY